MVMITALLSTYSKQIILALVGLLGLVTVYLKGQKSGAVKGERKADKAGSENSSLKAILKSEEIYDKAEAEIRHQSEVGQASLAQQGLSAVWGTNDAIELHPKNGGASHKLKSADLQIERD